MIAWLHLVKVVANIKEGCDSVAKILKPYYMKAAGRSLDHNNFEYLELTEEQLANFAMINADDFYGRDAIKRMGEFLSTAKKDDSVQAYALNQLRDFMYGKGNPIDTPVTFYDEYRKIMAVVEEKVADRNKSADPWGWNNYKSAIDEVIMSYMQNGQQLTGYKGR